MGNCAWVQEVRPVCEDECRKRHEEIRPKQACELAVAGIRNCNIYRHGLTLFGYFEKGDLDKAVEHLADSGINRRWGECMLRS